MKVPCCFAFCLIRADGALRKGHFELIQRSAVEILARVRMDSDSMGWALHFEWHKMCFISVSFTLCEWHFLYQGSKYLLETGSKYQNQAVEWHITRVKINGVSLWGVIKQVGGQETNELVFGKYAERVTSNRILPGKWWIRMEIKWWNICWFDVEMCMQWSKGVLQSITLCRLKRAAAFLIKCSRAVLLKLHGK